MKNFTLTLFCIAAFMMMSAWHSNAQCLNFINYPADTMGWAHGSSSLSGGYYNNDTFVVCNSTGGDNSYLYSTFPSTLQGTASTFTMSFDFRIDSNHSCSDGLTFWFFTSSLYGLGDMSKEGGNMGFPDTVSGFALAFRTIGCVDEIYMKKINSNSYYWSGGSGPDTDITSPLYSQMFLTDGAWHHCIVSYVNGFITTSFDGGAVTMTGYSPLYGTGHFGFMGTNGAGSSRKCLKNIQLCSGLGRATFAADSFGTYINRLCNGPQITTNVNVYSPTRHIKTHYGDGTHDSTGFNSLGSTGAYALQTHIYQAPGFYTVTQKLYDGPILQDTLSFLYENVFCATLPVKFFNDINANGFIEPGEPYVAQPVTVEVDSNGIAVDTISASSGFYYNARGAIGDVYAFKVLSLPGNLVTSSPASGIVYDSLVKGIFIYPIKYFGLSCTGTPGYDFRTFQSFRAGSHHYGGSIFVDNLYCLPQTATLTMQMSPKYNDLLEFTPAPLSVVGNTVTWSIAALSSVAAGPVQIAADMERGPGVSFTFGDTVMTKYTISPASGDADTTNNIVIRCDTVRSGYDPNEVLVNPATCLVSGITANKLEYTIHFENTGNDTAHNIYVMDTLSPYLDVSTFSLVMNTHEMYVSKYKDNAGRNIMKFDFPKIKLLDSSYHGQCMGGLIYTIKTKPGLADGIVINNRAGIYFDVNPVVLTNTASNTIGCPDINQVPDQAKNTSISIYPNPATNELTIKQSGGYNRVLITDQIGKALVQQPLDGGTNKINISSLPAGIYFVTLKGENGSKVQKFVKM